MRRGIPNILESSNGRTLGFEPMNGSSILSTRTELVRSETNFIQKSSNGRTKDFESFYVRSTRTF